MPRPTLIIISGPAGSGKTTLAHELARAVPCPAVIRDEIKEGMVHATSDFEAAWGDALTQRTFPVFFDVLRLLLTAGVTVVAEAAFQDKVWRPNLEPLAELAELRIVQCHADADIARDRIVQRGKRAAHADGPLLDALGSDRHPSMPSSELRSRRRRSTSTPPRGTSHRSTRYSPSSTANRG